AVDRRGPGRGGEVPGQDAHGGGLSRPVGAEEADDLALGDGERHVADGRVIAVIFGQVLDVDHARPPAAGDRGWDSPAVRGRQGDGRWGYLTSALSLAASPRSRAG